jgi:hypothetical protein
MKRWSMKAMWMAAAVSAAADSPYLPAVGPAPLRFATPPVVKTATVQLPPLITIEPRPAAVVPEVAPVPPTNAVPSAPDDPPANPVGPLIEPPPSIPVPYDPVVSNGVEVVRPDTDNLTPQMFMKFFTGRPGTNSSGMTIIAPMPFLPPAPPAPPAPSSKATYQTTPPAKP